MSFEEDLKRCKRKRGSIKALLTNFKKYVEQLQLKQVPLNDADLMQLQVRLSRANNFMSEFGEVQNEIDGMAEDLEEQYEERTTFEDEFCSIISNAKILAVNSDNKTSNVDTPSQQSPTSDAVNNKSGLAVQNVKLPTIELPKYQGDYDLWLEYRDTFESLIHDNDMLSSIQKFHYLRASLGGNALNVIKSIEFTANGYNIAWNILCDRYNNSKILIHNHVKALFSLESLHVESSQKFRKFLDDLSKHLRCLKQLGEAVLSWDTLLIFMITSKLGEKTQGEWEKHIANFQASPTLEDITMFLIHRADFLETLEFKRNDKAPGMSRNIKQPFRGFVTTKYTCNYCKNNHSIYTCENFLKLSISERIDFVQNSKLCAICLREGHPPRKCRLGPCRKCRKWHNTLLHIEIPYTPESTVSPPSTKENTVDKFNPISSLQSALFNSNISYVFLPTAYVHILDKNNCVHKVRALLDSASQSSFLSQSMCKRLGLRKEEVNCSVSGISNFTSSVQYKCGIQIQSIYSNFKANLSCFVLPEITGTLPSYQVDITRMHIPEHIVLSDPEFYKPAPIDILIGAELFWQLIGSRHVFCGKNQPIVQETKLGWVVSGPTTAFSSVNNVCALNANIELHNLITKFWEIEDLECPKYLSADEAACEENFQTTTLRNSDGRFIVSLPLKQSADCLGDSRVQAEKRFYNLERKLSKHDQLRDRYIAFMREYESLGHMTDSPDQTSSVSEYFMPHHGVLREESLTTKLRVVFDASAPSSNGLSLNNIQRVGPVIQEDLIAILLRFRKYKYVVSADVAKMYRQVLINNKQTNLQKIFWRENRSEPLKVYTLNTVTYGQAAASFLAIRSLFELANICEGTHPDIARIIRRDFYVDDLLTGSDNIEQTSHICKQLVSVLKSGCFELRKWYSNHPEVLAGMEHLGIECPVIEFAPSETAKTLGLTWSCHSDCLLYSIKPTIHERHTKRTVLSVIARIFDPLGLLSPCILTAKLLMQRLWIENLEWDQVLPAHLSTAWIKLKNDLPNLNRLEIPRHVVCSNPAEIELHGFSDASEVGYGACIYIRSVSQNGEIFVRLLCAKSKSAPIKSLTIPRLELCAALLLSRLVDKVVKSIEISFSSCNFWSDSTVVLAWITTSPHLLKTFISNRVSKIQSLTDKEKWRYIATYDNPADLVSRGLYPSQILESTMWFHGPQWLSSPSDQWPSFQFKQDCIPEMKPQAVVLTTATAHNYFFERFSSFSKLQRVTAYILRFKYNCLNHKKRSLGSLSQMEVTKALIKLVKVAQQDMFPDDYISLKHKGCVHTKSRILNLTPFLDNNDIIRVGGRLKNSDFPFEKKHPIVLNTNHRLTRLLFEYEHLKLLHAGPQLLLASIRDRFWPIGGRNLARATTKRCVRCFRFKPNITQPIMGNLPSERCCSSIPFSITGVDYAGPFVIRDRKGRGSKLEKCYVSLFICFSTRAIHLELVSSLSTDGFILALRRFISRRGKPSKIFSDNGTNFVGAKRELTRFLKDKKDEIVTTSVSEGIDWQFLPPYSPHFGGLWEAGVKSLKHHLRRVLTDAKLVFEEFTTVLTQVEAILNSRPLCPLSNDPNDFNVLTPAHFLIGKSLVATPDENIQYTPENRLTRFQLVQRISQHFWQRWFKEYISEMQQRTKWKTSQSHLAEGTLVLIKDDQTMPTEWKLGRIIELHKGSDGIARLASIKTRNGTVRRNFQKICPLPIND